MLFMNSTHGWYYLKSNSETFQSIKEDLVYTHFIVIILLLSPWEAYCLGENLEIKLLCMKKLGYISLEFLFNEDSQKYQIQLYLEWKVLGSGAQLQTWLISLWFSSKLMLNASIVTLVRPYNQVLAPLLLPGESSQNNMTTATGNQFT